MIGVIAWVVRMGLKLLVGLTVSFAVATLVAGKENLQKKINCIGTTGVLGMSCTLGDVTGVAGLGSVSGSTLGGAAGVT